MARRSCRLGPELTGLRVVADQAVLLGELRGPGGCLLTLGIHQREIEKGARRFPHQGSRRPRAVFSGFGVDLRIPVEQRADVRRNPRGRWLKIAATDVAVVQLLVLFAGCRIAGWLASLQDDEVIGHEAYVPTGSGVCLTYCLGDRLVPGHDMPMPRSGGVSACL